MGTLNRVIDENGELDVFMMSKGTFGVYLLQGLRGRGCFSFIWGYGM